MQAALLMATRPLGSSPRPQVRFNCQTRASRLNSALVRNHQQEKGGLIIRSRYQTQQGVALQSVAGVHPGRRVVCSNRIQNEGLRTATQSS